MSIHHIGEVSNLIENQAGAKLFFLPPYSPDLNPFEGALSQVKYMMKDARKLFEVTTSPGVSLALLFATVTRDDCTHITNGHK